MRRLLLGTLAVLRYLAAGAALANPFTPAYPWDLARARAGRDATRAPLPTAPPRMFVP
jgi:hypothetical protein